jgi:DNA modification methylase
VPTQEQIYRELRDGDLDPELSWAEHELPQRERTKHVHRLHPYLGKFVPQLVEIFLARHVVAGQWIVDPFAGSGTTLVECSTAGVNSAGSDISEFNALLAEVKTRDWNPFVVEHHLRDALARVEAVVVGRSSMRKDLPDPDAIAADVAAASPYLRTWFDPRALAELFAYRRILQDYPETSDLMRVILSRSARSSRLTTHFNLDFPKTPQVGPYECYKHRRVCSPTQEAYKFIRSYSLDTIKRVEEYVRLRKAVVSRVFHADSRSVSYDIDFDGLITSPPYPGRIDYHEQHRYSFELLDLHDREADEIGAASRGTNKAAVAAYVDDMAAVFSNAKSQLRPGAPVIIVIDDARSLYGEILERAGLEVDGRVRRHVNRRTGRRQGEFFEEIILART